MSDCTVAQIYSALSDLAPLWLAEDYDNPGLLVGDPQARVGCALLSLDITEETAAEAEKAGAQLLISHHPVIFRPVKNVVRGGNASAVWQLATRSLSAVCMHTNLDMANGGVNDALAAALRLTAIRRYSADKSKNYKKIVVFVPRSHARAVRLAMSEAGAGSLGAYDGCAFEANGTGYFTPARAAKPFVGEAGKAEEVAEVRVEAICAPELVKKVIAAMLAAHPYEVPAYDLFDDGAVADAYGAGRLGMTDRKMPLREFAESVKKALSASCVKVADAGRTAHAVAVCGGAVDEEIIEKAARAGADTLVTGELKHSHYAVAKRCGISVVEAGHFATETVILPVLRERLSARFPGVRFAIAQSNREPYYTV